MKVEKEHMMEFLKNITDKNLEEEQHVIYDIFGCIDWKNDFIFKAGAGAGKIIV